MAAFPAAGAHVVYQDDLYTMYDDWNCTEQVRFTDAEAAAMAADPAALRPGGLSAPAPAVRAPLRWLVRHVQVRG